MNREQKIQVLNILTNSALTTTEKFNQIKTLFPNYLNSISERKVIYEKIEGIFHD